MVSVSGIGLRDWGLEDVPAGVTVVLSVIVEVPEGDWNVKLEATTALGE